MKYLLVGGSNDGTWVDVHVDFTSLRMEERPAGPTGIYKDPDAKEKQELYKKEFIRAEGKDFFIFRVDGMSIDEMFGKLIECYSPKPKDQPKAGHGLSAAHAAAFDNIKNQLLIALIKRMGGCVSIPTAEIDDTGNDLLAFNVDAKMVFHFEVQKKG